LLPINIRYDASGDKGPKDWQERRFKVINFLTEQKKTFNHWEGGLVEGLRIDHIFVSPVLKSTEVKVMPNGILPGSDHHPVISTVDLSHAE